MNGKIFPFYDHAKGKAKMKGLIKAGIMVLTIAVLIPSGIVLVGSATDWFSIPHFVVSFLKWIGPILILISIVFFSLAVAEIVTYTEKEKEKGFLNNPASTLALLSIFCGILGTVAIVLLYISGNLGTEFQTKVLSSLDKILENTQEILKKLP